MPKRPTIHDVAQAAGVSVTTVSGALNGKGRVDPATRTRIADAVVQGGDLFAVVSCPAAAPVALNASGRAGSNADPERLRASGASGMPFQHDIRVVTVPGCVDCSSPC